ncbi:MAG: carbohydrate ABC transporter permease [Chloroflexota bacterium]|nr:carbohydrate ABC transporter permease [Chloroflexota bacterium]
MSIDHIKKIFTSFPTHAVLIGICLIWLIPTFGLLVTSFRPFQDINQSGWWTALAPRKAGGQDVYEKYLAPYYGPDGKAVAGVDLSDPELIGQFRRSIELTVFLREQAEEGKVQLAEMPDTQEMAELLIYLRQFSGAEDAASHPRFTLNNYIDAVMGYRGTANYTTDCATGEQSLDLNCNISDVMNPRGMGRAFVNSLLVTIPCVIIPLLFAAFAGYAFSWLDFPGRMLLFALLVGLQIVPLQMTLIPISRVYAQLGLNGTFLGVWLFHTGFGLPYAIYLMRNFIGSLPKDLFESAYLDGASHWTAFYRLALPLSVPAIASLSIFQFLWIWNDLLVALVFLGGKTPVLTYQISNMVSSLGAGWHLLTAAAFISMALPMVVFLGLQRFFVRGLLAGSVKG